MVTPFDRFAPGALLLSIASQLLGCVADAGNDATSDETTQSMDEAVGPNQLVDAERCALRHGLDKRQRRPRGAR